MRVAVAGIRPGAGPAPARFDRRNGRLALQFAYHAYAGGRTAVGHSADGRPVLRSRPDLYCSIAHSAGYGLAAVCDGPVGVDIERIRDHPRRALSLIAHPEEIEALDQMDYDAQVTRCWTIKEAVLKGLGTGLSMAPHRLRLRPWPHPLPSSIGEVSPTSGRFAVDGPDGRSWMVFSQRANDCFLAIAVADVACDFRAVDWH